MDCLTTKLCKRRCNTKCCKCRDSNMILSVEWSDYVRMFKSITWKNIPQSPEKIDKRDKKYYDKIVMAIHNYTDDTPSMH